MMQDARTDRAVETMAFAAVDVGDGLRTVKLSPWGDVASLSGRYLIDDEAAAAILARFAEHGTALPIDIEHESLPEYAPAAGGRGAVGFIESLHFESGRGIFGQVRWNAEGRRLIREGAFRYLSPVLMVRKSDRRAVELHSAALTNKPAIPKMEQLAASEPTPVDLVANVGMGDAELDTEDGMILEEMRELLDVQAAGERRDILKAMRDKLRDLVDAMKKTAASETTARDGTEIKAMREEIDVLKRERANQHAETLVANAIKAGKINPNHETQLAYARKVAIKDPGEFERYVAACPQVHPVGKTAPPGPRMMTIINAEQNYRLDDTVQRATSLKAFVNQNLVDAGFERLTEQEAATLRQPQV